MEKHGGSVSQPYSWRVARFLKDSVTPLKADKIDAHSSSDVVLQLRRLEEKTEASDPGERTLDETEDIRACARSLWSRRVGVIVRNLDRVGPC